MEQIARMTENSSEQDSLAEHADGRREALESLFTAHHRRVFSVALNFFGGDSVMAEDVTQQVFLKIFSKLKDFRGDAEMTTWLYRITINCCIDEQRKSRRFLFFSDFFGFNEPKTNRTQDEKFFQKEISGEVQKAVATLKIKFRLPIVLKYVENLSYREIAEILECSEGTVASRLNRGHKMLARKLAHLKDEI